MKVVYLTQVFEVGQDPGSERHFYFCKYLLRHGHQAIAVTSNVDYKKAIPKYPGRGWHVRCVFEGVDVHYVYSYANFRGSFKKRFWYYLTYLFTALITGLFVEKPDVIYAVSTPLTVGFLGYLISRLRGIPFVFEVTDIWPDAALVVGVIKNEQFIRAARWMEMLCYHKAARIVALTEGIRDNIIAKGIAPDKVVLITNGVDPTLFDRRTVSETERARVRQELGFDNHFVCMYLGAHGDYNALDTVIDAADALRGDPRYLCALVGDGDDKPRLQAIVQKRGLANVCFLPPVSRMQAPVLLQAADVFLLPNRRGAFYTMNLPNKLFDFLASQRPIVVAGHGESGNLVERAAAGCVVEAEDGKAMAQAVTELAALSHTKLDAMGEAGRQYVLTNFSREDLSRTFLDVLERAVQNS